MPKISVIIPVYNGAKFVKDAIESVLAQTYKDYEIIVVNDGSTDDTEEVLRPYIEEGIIRYFYQENQGSANARNRAIAEAKGEYIAWLDQDDIWLPHRLEKTVRVMENDKEVVVVGGWFLDIDESGIPKGCNWFIKPGIVNEQLRYGNAVASSSSLIRRSVIVENNEWFDQSFWPRDDYHMWVRLAKYGKIVVIPSVLYLYRHHSEQNIRKHNVRKDIPKNLLSEIKEYGVSFIPSLYYKILWKLSLYKWGQRLLYHGDRNCRV